MGKNIKEVVLSGSRMSGRVRDPDSLKASHTGISPANCLCNKKIRFSLDSLWVGILIRN